MKNSEALQASIELNYKINSSTLELALINNGLVAADDYSVENKKKLDMATCSVILTLCSTADLEEGQVKITQANRNYLLKLRSTILGGYGIPDGFNTNPTISNASRLW